MEQEVCTLLLLKDRLVKSGTDRIDRLTIGCGVFLVLRSAALHLSI